MRLSALFLPVAMFAFLATSGEAKFAKQPLEETIERTQVMVDATIIGSEVVTLKGRQESCGTIYCAKIKETFAGPRREIIAFGSEEEFVTGRRYLLFLNEASGFSHDVIEERTTDEEKKYGLCLRRLPMLKSQGLFTASFVGLNNDRVRLGYLTIPPTDLKVRHMAVRSVELDETVAPVTGWVLQTLASENALRMTVVEWQELRQWLLDKLRK